MAENLSVVEAEAAALARSDPAAGLREVLANLDREVEAYARLEAEDAARKEWALADRWRYMASGVAQAVEAVRQYVPALATTPTASPPADGEDPYTIDEPGADRAIRLRSLRCLLRRREPGQTPFRRITEAMATDLLAWAATLDDQTLLDMRGVGPAMLHWIRAHQLAATPTASPTTGEERE